MAYYAWGYTLNGSRTDGGRAAARVFQHALPVLKHNGLFLQQYSQALASQHQYAEAVGVLAEAGKYYHDDGWYINILATI